MDNILAKINLELFTENGELSVCDRDHQYNPDLQYHEVTCTVAYHLENQDNEDYGIVGGEVVCHTTPQLPIPVFDRVTEYVSDEKIKFSAELITAIDQEVERQFNFL